MNVASIKPELRELPIATIDAPELPSRSSMDETAMSDLVASMRANGFISVIVVARVGERYEVIAGHRRRVAAGLAGIAMVPALVYPSKAAGLEAIQHAENKHRENLNPADESIWFAQLLELHADEGTDGVAARVGESRAYVEGRIGLLHGDEQIFRALGHGAIGVGVAQQLNRCTDELHRRMLLDLAIRNGATVAMVSGWIAEWKQVHEPATRALSDGSAVAAPGPAVLNDYFTCHLCGTKNHPANMRPIQIHDYCVPAILEPALDLYRRRGDVLRMPATYEAAVELLNDLIDRWPALAGGDSAQP